tara:strand:+ start:300 stop:818 length:519 start_codon:yes stop_codon:yes gene_type:complete
MIKEINSNSPKISRNVYISETAIVIGDVTIGDYVNIWFGSVVRGDMHFIKIGSRTNIQDNSVIHVTTKESPTKIGSGVTIGHGAIIHGCTIENDCLIGMGAIIMDNVVIGSGSLVAAGALITPGTEIPKNSVVIGSPAKVIRKVSIDERKMILDRPQEYIDLASKYVDEKNN